ncbi:hypothetical protein DPMN_114691 [Dreissena polymorpha]|uniref:Zonadhesin n=1 Tax=Dreissena polymorpha TaxID=45954 RepID=A0A9D4QSR2_DREPO|nr:hypothetical protein DPMN_114691 [Dreissena polymorpha]
MTMRHAFLILIGISLIKSLPLRPSDLRGSHGHIIHYHRNDRGSTERHIHFHPPVTRTQPSHTLQQFLRPNLSDPGTLYEVPSNRHYNRGDETGDIDVAIKELSDNTAEARKAMALTQSSYTIKGDDQVHLPSLQGVKTKTIRHADLPLNEGLNFQQHIQHGNQDLKYLRDRLDVIDVLSRGSGVTNNATIHTVKVKNTTSTDAIQQGALKQSFSTLIPGHIDNRVSVSGKVESSHTQHTNLSSNRHNQTHVRGSSQHIGKSKQDEKPLNSTQIRSHIQQQNLNGSTGTKNGSKVSQLNCKDKLIIGMFKTHYNEMRNLQMVRETKPLYDSVHTEFPFEEDYQRSTIHTGPITKRGVMSDISQTRSDTFIDNLLNIRFAETTIQTYLSETQPTIALATTQVVTTPEIISVKSTATPDTKTPTTINGSPVGSSNTTHVAHNDLIQLNGIHIVFSNGLQNASNQVPTIHLTASLTPPGASSQGSQQDKSSDTSNNFVEKLVGTAVIRNGHLYLVIHPFGPNKSLDMIFNKTHHKRVNMTPSQTQLPVTETTQRTTVTTTPMPTTTKEGVVDLLAAFASDFFIEQSTLDEQHQHMHHDHQAHIHSNLTATESVLKPVPRFLSPWHNISLAKIIPYPGRNSSKNIEKREDNDYELFQFIANASDPFEQIQTVIEAIANASKLNYSSDGDASNSNGGNAAFNFELKIQSSSISDTFDTKPTTPPVDSSDEATDSNIDSLNIKSHSDQTSLISQLPTTVTAAAVFSLNTNESNTLQSDQAQQVPRESGAPWSTTTQQYQPITKVPADQSPFHPKLPAIAKVYPSAQTTDAPDSRTTSPSSDIYETVVSTAVTAPTTLESVSSTRKVTEQTLFQTTSTEPMTTPVSTTYITSSTTTPTSYTTTQEETTTQSSTSPTTATTTSTTKTSATTAATTTEKAPIVTSKPTSNYLNLFSDVSPNFALVNKGSAISKTGHTEQVNAINKLIEDIRRIQFENMFKYKNTKYGTGLPNLPEPIRDTASQFNHKRIQDTSPVRSMQTQLPSVRHSIASHHNTDFSSHLSDMNNVLGAKLVLFVDDMLVDHTSLHGALLVASRSDTRRE